MTRQAEIKRLCDELEQLRRKAEALCKELTQEMHRLEHDEPRRGTRRGDAH
jgi:hypothetical protein